VAQVFSDLEELAMSCEFLDCSHTTEAGCAITAAVAAGRLLPDRMASWLQLRRETPVDTPQVARLRIAEGKRLKRTAKASKTRARATQRKLAPPPASPQVR
jgi:ribosome biogenesis GTPase